MATPKIGRFATQETLDIDYSTLEQIERYARETRERLEAQGWSALTVEMDEAPYDDSGRQYAYIMGTRMETQEEAEKREAHEAAMEANRLAGDRATYERLRKQFEGK